MFVVWFIVFIQFALISWLVYDKFKPKEVDPWLRAKEILAGWRKDDAKDWETKFNGPEAVEQVPDHSIIHAVRTKTPLGKDSLDWTCSCGYATVSSSPFFMNIMFEKHVRDEKEISKYMKGITS